MNLKIEPRRMARAGALPFRNDNDLSIVANRDAWPKSVGTPAETDHVVVGCPMQEGIVAGVEHDQSAASSNVVFERLLHLSRPAHAVLQMAAVEVVDHHVIARKL